MLTCLEIVNILYYKCVDLCYDIKYKYNRVFNNNRHRPRPYNYNSIYENDPRCDLLDIYNSHHIEKLNIKRSEIPAVTHVDYSARVQTVTKEDNEIYFNLIKKFQEKTNCPVLVNTSFNIRGEPIVNTPNEAIDTFLKTDIDVLVCENYIIEK